MQRLNSTHDLIVVVPGITGSTLLKDGKEVWGLSSRTALRTLRTFGASVRELGLPPDIGDDDPHDGVTPGALMPSLHVVPGLWSPVTGYDRLVRGLRQVLVGAGAPTSAAGIPENLITFPYDWRLSNRLNGRRLGEAIEPALERLRARGGAFAEAEVTLVCHSMGGLLARWYVEKEGGRDTTRRLITLGTPFRGSMNALRDLVNGVRKGFGRFGLDLSDFSRSLPSAHQLLPHYACIEGDRGLLQVTETSLQGLDRNLVEDAVRFHDALGEEPDRGPSIQPILGYKQPTATTASVDGERLVTRETIDGDDERGDGTVPRLSAAPRWMAGDDAAIHPLAEHHGALQANPAVLDALEGALTASRVVRRAAAGADLAVRAPETALAGEPIEVEAEADPGWSRALVATAYDERGRKVLAQRLDRQGASMRTRMTLPAGAHLIQVGGPAAQVRPVTVPVLVWAEDGNA